MLAVGTDLPVVDVICSDVELSVPAANLEAPPGFLAYLGKLATLPLTWCSRKQRPHVAVLAHISCTFTAGRSTLVLAAPGAGSSSLLRIITGRQRHTGGQLLFNGSTPHELQANGVQLRKLAAYCAESDDNEYLLTVSETFAFAYASAVVPPPTSAAAASARDTGDDHDRTAPAAAAVSDGYTPPDADDMIRIMGLEVARDTIVGNPLVRGISGGQKRRVSVGETALLNARVVALDGATNGLDAVTAHEVVRYFTDWARQTNGVVVATLQQPLPETFALFDDVLLLSEGRLLYHGPQAGVDAYLTSIGYVRPSYLDVAEWAIQCVSRPVAAALLSLEDCRKVGELPGCGCAARVPTLLTVDAIADYWQTAGGAAGGAAATTQRGGVQLQTPYARQQYGSQYTSGVWAQVALTTRRELLLARRNWLYTGARIFNAVAMGAILGTVFITLQPAQFFLFFSVSLFAVTFVSFLNNAIIPIAMASRSVVYKHMAAGLFSEHAYNAAVLAGHIPTSMIANFLFATILYWIVGYAADVTRWLVFVLVILAMDLCISVLYRSFSYATPSQELAMIASSLFTAVGLATGGFFVVRNQVPPFLIWLLYASPFFWSVDAIANNEFSASKYAVPFSPTQTQGEAFMATFAFQYGVGWKWMGIGILFAYYLMFGLVVQPWLLKHVRYDIVPGTQRLPLETTEEARAELAAAGVPPPDVLRQAMEQQQQQQQQWQQAEAGVLALAAAPPATGVADSTPAVVISAAGAASAHGNGQPVLGVERVAEVPARPPGDAPSEALPVPHQLLTGPLAASASGQATLLCAPPEPSADTNASMLPVPPVTLAFRDITYDVTVKGGVTKRLLRGVLGYAAPGQLLALCGASGAGKTTLLDVLAYRKTTGTINGSILLNGAPATATTFARNASFAEQADEHIPTATVREALLFSAKLRAPAHVPIGPLVDDVISTLQLGKIAHRQVGTLSRGQLKLVSLGVELSSASGLLFADEPTTGLSARAAAIVVTCLQRAAARGRTVICTIHQPSAHLFFAFSHLLLLAPGGHQVYFGPVGHHAAEMVHYFEGIQGVAPLPLHKNPASWMLEVLEHTPVVPAGRTVATQPPVDNGVVVPVTSPLGGEPQLASAGTATKALDTSAVTTAGIIGALPAEPPVAAAATDIAVASALPVPASATEGADTGAEKLSAEDFAAIYMRSSLAASNNDHVQLLAGQTVASAPPAELQAHGKGTYARSFPTQAVVVTRRALVDSWRNSAYTANRVIAIAFLGLFFGLLYLDLDYGTFQGIQSATGAVLASMGFCGVTLFTIGVPLYMSYRGAFYRERAARLYPSAVHALSLLVVETLWVTALCIVFVSIFYYLLGVPGRAGFNHFLFFLLGTYICVLCFAFAAVCAAALFPSSILAQLAGGVFLSCLFLFAGIFVPKSAMPVGWRWFMSADFAFHLTRAMASELFYCAGAGCPTIQVATPSGPQTVGVYDFVSSNFRGGYGQRWGDFGIAALILAGFVAAAFLLWHFVNHQKR